MHIVQMQEDNRRSFSFSAVIRTFPGFYIGRTLATTWPLHWLLSELYENYISPAYHAGRFRTDKQGSLKKGYKELT